MAHTNTNPAAGDDGARKGFSTKPFPNSQFEPTGQAIKRDGPSRCRNGDRVEHFAVLGEVVSRILERLRP
jgi:hypothetical protein